MKFNKNIQAWLILAAFIITLAVLFGGQALTMKLRVNDPLKQDIYAIKGVRKFTVTQDKEGVKVELQLSQVTDLQQALDTVQQKVKSYYNKPVRAMTIADHSNRRLKEIRYRLSFDLEEAVVTGHYIQLKESLDVYPQIKSRIYFSPDFIYIQLEDGLYYHYEAFPRQIQGAGKTVGGDLV
jgi:hypothetical protein